MKRSALLLVPVLLLLSFKLEPIQAQTATDPNSGFKFERDDVNSIWRIKWWAKSGRTYFIQHSEDLQQWFWFPVVEAGDDSIKEWGFTSNGTKSFFRLIHTEAPTDDPEGGDFDGDGMSNLAEVQQSSDPLNYYSQGGTIITPVLSIVSGNHQALSPGGFSGPLAVKVTNGISGPALPNAPVTFSVAGGSEALAQSPTEVAEFFSTLTLRTDPLTGEISNLQDKVHVRLPAAPSSSLQINAAAAGSLSGSVGLPVQFMVYNYNPFIPPSAPTGLDITANGDGSLTYTWQDNSDSETGFTVEYQLSDGSWAVLGSTGPNVTSLTVSAVTVAGLGLTPASNTRAIAINGAGPSGSGDSEPKLRTWRASFEFHLDDDYGATYIFLAKSLATLRDEWQLYQPPAYVAAHDAFVSDLPNLDYGPSSGGPGWVEAVSSGSMLVADVFTYRHYGELSPYYGCQDTSGSWSAFQVATSQPVEAAYSASYIILKNKSAEFEAPDFEALGTARFDIPVGKTLANLTLEGMEESGDIHGDEHTLYLEPEPKYNLNNYNEWTSRNSYLLIPAELIPNFNRDETIDMTGSKDRGKVTTDKPWRWWINDDSDNGDIAEGDSDEPGALDGWFEFDGRDPNHADTKVNGRCDLVDFFPLFLDIKQMIEVLPPSASIQYKLKQEDAALGFVYTDLTPAQADDFCVEDPTTGYGPNFTQPAKDAIVTKVPAAGVALSTAFLNKIKDDGKGVLLFEASKATDKPLVLEVTKDGTKIAELKFSIKADSVEKMYRWVNLRPAISLVGVHRPTNLNQPVNYPDELTNGKNFLLVHGYSVREQQARGWNAEVFKRLHQLGSKAKYVAVTWSGDESKLPDQIPVYGGATADYHENVINAFKTSPFLAEVVNGLSGEKYIAGHSLGNMVVSSAIKDHSMNVSKYYAVDAAVAMEAYDASLESNTSMRNLMRHPNWPDFETRLWSSEWYKLFGSSFALNDGRNKLTWRGRFGNIANAINFHSTGEEVLKNPPNGEVPELGATLAWVTQEKVKGTFLAQISTFSAHGGWAFNVENPAYYREEELGPDEGPTRLPIYPGEAALLTDAQLRADSFFRRFADNRLYNASQGSAAANEYPTRAKMLAEGMPALSFATGANALTPFNPPGGQNRNVNLMDLKTGTWPRATGEWHHSDFREVAFYFTQKLYKRFIDEGALKQ